MASAVGQNREIEQLKTLLFQTEAMRLKTLETELASLQNYVGNAERLEAATADILVAAFQRAEVDRPRELASALAPSVVSAIRSEIKNSRELMVDALYPITGRLVSAAVANAFKELFAFLEQRINALTSAELWIGHIKSLVTGRPISEFVVANSNPPRVKRLLIIERGSGRLVAHWKRENIPDEQADLLSAMVAAILEFSVQALAGEGNLQTLDFGGREIVLRASERFILTAECIGPLRPADDSRINSLFFDTIERIDQGASCDTAMLAALAASIENDAPAAKKTSRRGRVILFTVVALAAAMLAWQAGTWVNRTMLERRTNAAVQQLAGEQPLLEAFPLRLKFDHQNRSLSVFGIEPGQVDISSVIDGLAEAAAPYRIVNRIGVFPGSEQSAALAADIEAVQQSIAHIQTGVDEMRERIAEESKSSNQRHDELVNQYATLQSLVDGPTARLSRFMDKTAIFYRTGDASVDNQEAERQIRQLAELLANNDLRIRIVGHADESGSESANKVLARERAEQVMRRLTSLGVDPSRLFVVSRSASMPISNEVSPTNDGNRRVTFENVFQTESSH